MNILFVVPYVPNLIRVRPYNLIRYLTERGHRVTVATLWTGEAERESLKALNEICHTVIDYPLAKQRSYMNCLAALPGTTPLQAVYCWQPELAEKIAVLTGQPGFDVMHVEHLRGARFGLKRDGRSLTIPVVWDSVDCISHLFRQSAASSRKVISRLMTRFELGRTEKYEGWLLGQFEHVLVTSRNDREALLSLRQPSNGAAPVTVLPNGVDLNYFKPAAGGLREPATLVISGKMSYHANVSMVLYFTSQILPKIRAARPDVKLTVVGKDPPREILALANEPGITVTGTVNDIRPYLQRATAAVAPLTYGAGIQNKVLEAMACSTPVVTTLKAVSALDTAAGRDLLVGENEDQFAEQTVRLLCDPALSAEIGAAGRRYVEEHHHWADIAAKLESVYFETIHRYNGKKHSQLKHN